MTVKRAVESYGVKKITVLTRTSRDIRTTVVPEILSKWSEDDPNAPHYSPSRSDITFPNGAKIIFIPAEAGVDSVRGSQCEILLGDEIAFASQADELVTQSLLTCRLGMSKAYFFTTPKAVQPIIDWVHKGRDANDKSVAIVTGNSFENADNLSRTFLETTINKYKGTRAEAVEIYGQLILTNDAALWDMTTIERNKTPDLPNFVQYAIGCDPAITTNSKGAKGRSADNTGIVVSGIDENGTLYVLDDYSGSFPVERWVSKVIELYDSYSAIAPTGIYIESNAGGQSLLESAFDKARKNFQHNITFKFSTASKLARAMPYSLLAEQNKIKYADNTKLDPLFDELISYDGTGKSPDRMDAMVFSLSLLKPHKKRFSGVQELRL